MSEHLTDPELRNFTAGKLSPDDVLSTGDHLSVCSQCRRRAADLAEIAKSVGDFRDSLSESSIHLSDEELQDFVQGRLAGAQLESTHDHLKTCATCASQVEDLQSWAGPGMFARTRQRWLAIAAAIVVAASLPALWQLRSGRQKTPGSLAGIESLPPADQALIRAALSAGVAPMPPFLEEMNAPRDALMGAPSTPSGSFDLTHPVATATVTDRPRFEWKALPKADEYMVTIFSEQLNVIIRSPGIHETAWTPAEPLARGKTYVWQVSAKTGPETITSPAAPAPPARFHVIPQTDAELLQRLEAQHPDACLLLGILNMNAGVQDAAARHLRQVSTDDPNYGIARRSLERLAALGQVRAR